MHLPLRACVAALAAGLLLVAGVVHSPVARAHSELIQASPAVDSVVGGEFHSVDLQFIGLDQTAPFRAELLDPAGQPIGQPAIREKMRLIIPIEPLEVPGTYSVSFTTTGVDGDLVSDIFSFRYDPDAPEPEGITIGVGSEESFGWIRYVILLIGAAALGYLVHRVRWALREHQAAQELT